MHRGPQARWRRAAHLDLISDAIVAALRGDIPPLILCEMPPRHGKSWLISRIVPGWFLDLFPHKRVLLVSYDGDFAAQWGRTVRDDMKEFSDLGLVRTKLSPSRKASNEWETTAGGGMKCAGVGGGTTGRGSDLFIVDDPIKDLADANSPTMRKRLWEWWQSVAFTRQEPGCVYIVLHCIVAGMRILTGTGRWVPVEDIRPGDTVVSLAPDGRSLVTASVTAARKSGNDPILTVHTDRLSISVNGRHPFARLVSTGQHADPRRIEWVRAEDLNVDDVVVTAKSLPDDYVPDDRLPDGSAVSHNIAWLLGYLLGDGWVTAHTRRNQQGTPTSYAICAALGSSPTPEKADLSERVRGLLAGWSPNRVYDTPAGYVRTDWNHGGRLLHGMGYGAGAKGKRIPASVWSWSVSLRRSFLEGWCEADGARIRKGNRGRFRLASASYDLIRDARDLALTCGVRPTIIYTSTITVQPPHSPAPVQSTMHVVDLHFIPDKAEGQALVGYTRPDRSGPYVSRHPNPQQLRYERIRSITPGPVSAVYDLTVEGTESFVAEGFVVHNTRWHEDDLIGHLIRESGIPFYELKLTAIAEEPSPQSPTPDALHRAPGEALWPFRYPVAALDRIRTGVGPYVWASLYQQRPMPLEGNLFKRVDLRYWHRDPATGLIYLEHDEDSAQDEVVEYRSLRRFCTCDLSIKEKTSADFTCIGHWGYSRKGALILLSGIHEQMDGSEHLGLIRRQHGVWKAAFIGIESVQYQATLIQAAIRKGFPARELKADTDKVTRAIGATPYFAAHQVFFPAEPDFDLDSLESELLLFPNAAHDDWVDMVSYATLVLQQPWFMATASLAGADVGAGRASYFLGSRT